MKKALAQKHVELTSANQNLLSSKTHQKVIDLNFGE